MQRSLASAARLLHSFSVWLGARPQTGTHNVLQLAPACRSLTGHNLSGHRQSLHAHALSQLACMVLPASPPTGAMQRSSASLSHPTSHVQHPAKTDNRSSFSIAVSCSHLIPKCESYSQGTSNVMPPLPCSQSSCLQESSRSCVAARSLQETAHAVSLSTAASRGHSQPDGWQNGYRPSGRGL